MTAPDSRASPSAMLMCVLLAFVLYGSLYPFDFQWPTTALQWFGQRISGSDAAANLLLFFPYGLLCAAHRSSRSMSSLSAGRINLNRRIWPWLLVGVLVAGIAQVAQIYLPSRNPALIDMVWNVIGLALGYAFWRIAGSRFKLNMLNKDELTRLVLGAIAVAWIWFPMVPTLQPSLVIDNIKGLGLTVQWADVVADVAIAIPAWLAINSLCFARTALNFRCLMTGLIVLGSVFMRGNFLLVADLIAALVGLLISITLSRNYKVLLSITLLCYALSALLPWQVAATLNTIEWLPFSGLLTGDAFWSMTSLISSLLITAILISLLYTITHSAAAAIVVTFISHALIEAAQLLLAGRHPDTTAPFITLLAALMVLAMGRQAVAKWLNLDAIYRSSGPEFWSSLLANVFHSGAVVAASGTPESRVAVGIARLNTGRFTFALLSSLGLAFLLAFILRLPNIPYNIKELFLPWFAALWIFVLAMLWLGYSCAWAANRLTVKQQSAAWLMPYAIGAVLIFYALLLACITDESLADIAGSANLRWFLVKRNLWGESGVWLATAMPAALFDSVEHALRFLALWLPAFLLLALALYWFKSAAKRSVLLNSLWLLPALWASKWVAFDHASTDNLNELIDVDAFFGWGGGIYLYALTVLLAITSAKLALTFCLDKKHIIRAILLILASASCSWFLINGAQVTHFVKYGTVEYSALDFLLGPNRVDKLPIAVLYWRWNLIYVVGIVWLAYSMRLALGPDQRSAEKRKSTTPRFAGMPVGKDYKAGVVRHQ